MYTQIPNDCFDLMKYMSASAWMCYTLICRRTLGWHKQSDVISNSQFVADTGLTKVTVIRALKELVILGVTEITPTAVHGQPANRYQLCGVIVDDLGGIIFIPPSIKSVPPSIKSVPAGIKIDTEVVQKIYPQKKDIQKKQIKKGEARESKTRDPLLDCWQIITYQQIAKRHVPILWRQKVVDTVTDEKRWKELLVTWIGSGWNIGNVSGILQRYEGANDKRRTTRQDAGGSKPQTSGGLSVREYLESEGFTGFQ